MQFKDTLIILLLALKACIIKVNCTECPPKELLNPCDCDAKSISCGGSQNYNISKVFKTINDNWDQNEKQFEGFILENTVIEELSEELFHGIKFKKIFLINTIDLKRITPKAFKATNELIEEFHQIGKSNLGETNDNLRELFDALSSLTNVKWIHFEGITITSIPTYAFRNENQDKLSVIDFIPLSPTDKYGLIDFIGDYAFYHLNNLKYIELSYQKIRHISKNVFDFEKPSNDTLIINLADNYLKENSFSKGVFMNAKRPLFIHLYNNQIKYLEESVFLPFLKLNKNNKINIGGFNPFQCDCNSLWILREKNIIGDQIQGMVCRDGKSFSDLNELDFKNCIH